MRIDDESDVEFVEDDAPILDPNARRRRINAGIIKPTKTRIPTKQSVQPSTPAAKQTGKNAASVEKAEKIKNSGKASGQASGNLPGKLMRPRVSTTKEEDPRCELTAYLDGRRIHIMTLKKRTYGINFQDVCTHAANMISSSGWSKQDCLDYKCKLCKS